ncbi:MAG: hypothetical protein QOI34_471, partial [Verrucomicrobiota bacterium]
MYWFMPVAKQTFNAQHSTPNVQRPMLNRRSCGQAHRLPIVSPQAERPPY